MHRLIRSLRESKLWRIHTTIFAATLAFAAVVEAAHMRRFMAKRDWRVVTTTVAAATCLYMASEALEGKWPSWGGYGYDDSR